MELAPAFFSSSCNSSIASLNSSVDVFSSVSVEHIIKEKLIIKKESTVKKENFEKKNDNLAEQLLLVPLAQAAVNEIRESKGKIAELIKYYLLI